MQTNIPSNVTDQPKSALKFEHFYPESKISLETLK